MTRKIIRATVSLLLLAIPLASGACIDTVEPDADLELRQATLPDRSTPVCPPLEQQSLQTNLDLLEQAWPAGTIPDFVPQSFDPGVAFQVRLELENTLVAEHDYALAEVAGGVCTAPIGPFNIVADQVQDPNDIFVVSPYNQFTYCWELELELKALEMIWDSLRDLIWDCMAGTLTCSQSDIDSLINSQSNLSRHINSVSAHYHSVCN